jgi:hypothetical protein
MKAEESPHSPAFFFASRVWKQAAGDKAANKSCDL